MADRLGFRARLPRERYFDFGCRWWRRKNRGQEMGNRCQANACGFVGLPPKQSLDGAPSRRLARFTAPIAFDVAMRFRALDRPFKYACRAPRIDGSHGRT